MTFGRRGRVCAGIFMAACAIFVIAPIALAVLFAFQSGPRLALPFDGPSLEWFRTILAQSQFSDSLMQSLKVAAGVGVLSAILGCVGAQAILSSSRSRKLLAAAAALPSMFPALLIALGCALILAAANEPPGLIPTILGQTTIAAPLAGLIILARARNLDPTLASASRDLGASRFTTFRRITFPLLRTAVLAGGCLAMAISFDELIIAFFAGAGSPTVPVTLWGMLRGGVDPSANAIAVVVLACSSVLVGIGVGQLKEDLEKL